MSAFRNAATMVTTTVREPALVKQIIPLAGRRLKADVKAFGLKRDLDVPHTAPEALIPIHVRPIRDEDVPHVLESADGLSLEERWDRNERMRLLEGGHGTCFVAVTEADEPCYVQWLFTSKDNNFLRHHFGGTFPALDTDTALLEGAYTPTQFRGKRIMSAAMSLNAEQARGLGARYVITFVGVENTASLKGCYRSGFAIYLERNVRWRMLRPTVTFRPAGPESAQAA